jgi:hypothetical protein
VFQCSLLDSAYLLTDTVSHDSCSCKDRKPEVSKLGDDSCDCLPVLSNALAWSQHPPSLETTTVYQMQEDIGEKANRRGCQTELTESLKLIQVHRGQKAGAKYDSAVTDAFCRREKEICTSSGPQLQLFLARDSAYSAAFSPSAAVGAASASFDCSADGPLSPCGSASDEVQRVCKCSQ